MELKQYTITMESGTRFGGKYRDEAHVRDSHKGFSGKIDKIEQRRSGLPKRKQRWTQTRHGIAPINYESQSL